MLLGPAPIKGDIGNEVQQVPLELATNRLAESFNTGMFQVYFMPNAGVSALTSLPYTFRINLRCVGLSMLLFRIFNLTI